MAPRKPITAIQESTATDMSAKNNLNISKEGLEALENKRDAFVAAMNTLSYAAQTAARTGFDYFNVLAEHSGIPVQSTMLPIGESFNAHMARAMSVAPDIGHAGDTEDEGNMKKKRRTRVVKEKDPDAPKRPLSAYLQFANSARPMIRQDMGEVHAKEIMTEAAARWKALSATDRQAWDDNHRAQMINWYRELNAYRASKGLAPENVPEQFRSDSTTQAVTNDAESANGDDSAEGEDVDQASEDDEPTPPPVAPTPVSKKFRAINHKDTPKASPAKGSPAVPESSNKRKRATPSNGNKKGGSDGDSITVGSTSVQAEAPAPAKKEGRKKRKGKNSE